MKIWLLKRKCTATNSLNIISIIGVIENTMDNNISISTESIANLPDHKKEIISTPLVFFRKKDAQLFKEKLHWSELEIVSFTSDDPSIVYTDE